jgi:disulfide bond formation protein DsbB
MNTQSTENNVQCKISIVDILIYTFLSLVFNFSYFYFQYKASSEEMNWSLLGVSTLIWFLGISLTRLSFLYAKKKTNPTKD